jgi:uncharacterized surface protein with fasciclin (FAS1) repeats
VPSLSSALTQAGCSNFLAFIESDPTLLALYNSGKVKTVFAPSDAYFSSSTAERLRRAALTSLQEQQGLLGAAQSSFAMSLLTVPLGTVISTFDNVANLNGQNQVVVSQPQAVTSARRWSLNDLDPRQATAVAKLSSGLGNQVSVINADQPFTSGLVQVTTGLFTVPQTLSQTASTTGLTTFNALTGQANMTSSLDTTPQSTFFIPTNGAFQAAGVSTTASTGAAEQIVQNHVVTGIAGYLPTLQNGDKLTTAGGGTLQVTVNGGQTFINGVQIVQPNVILPNGVAHIMGQVIPNTAVVQPVSSSAPVTTPAAATTPVTVTTPATVATTTRPVVVPTAGASLGEVAWSVFVASGAVALFFGTL